MLDDLIARSTRHDQGKHDHGPAAARQHYSFDSHGDINLAPEIWAEDRPKTLTPTPWAHRQICQRLGPVAFPGSNRALPAEYLEACPGWMRADQFNHWLGGMDDKRKWFVRGYKDVARAVLTDRYSSVGVTETLEWVREAIDTHGSNEPVTIHNPVVTPDVLHLRVLTKQYNTGGGSYALGGYFTTGEIGNRRLGAYPLVQRTSCTNSIVVPIDAAYWEHTHTGSRALLKRLFIDSIFGVLNGAVEALERLLAADERQLPDIGKFVDGLVKDKGWTEETRDSILVGTEGHSTLFGVVNGISRAAQEMEPDARADMEMTAGLVLVARAR